MCVAYVLSEMRNTASPLRCRQKLEAVAVQKARAEGIPAEAYVERWFPTPLDRRRNRFRHCICSRDLAQNSWVRGLSRSLLRRPGTLIILAFEFRWQEYQPH